MNSILISSYRNIFLLGLLVFLITAYFSDGYYHPDEHFQILEFCNYKLGKSIGDELPWEFQQSMRPALQPTLAFLIIKLLNIFNVFSPFTQVLILRILTACLSWFIVSKTCLLLLKDFTTETGKKIFLLLSLFLWFIPSISVRFSSENYSGMSFLIAIYLILKFPDENSKKKIIDLVLIGLLLGFSFFFRFQIAFAMIGLGLWLLFVKKLRWDYLIILIISGIAAMAACMGIDYWFYGRFEITAFNYFFENIVEHKAAGMGSYPWWHYIQLFIFQVFPPISLFLILFFSMGLYRKPMNIFTWCIVPFLFAHFIVDHKEMRFLFPMVFSFIYLAALGIDDFLSKRKYLTASSIAFRICIVFNTPLLIFKMFTPSQEAINYYHFLYDYSSSQKMDLLCMDKDVYVLLGLKVNFYRSPNVKPVFFLNEQDRLDYINKMQPDSLYILEKNLASDLLIPGYTNERIYNYFPNWILHFNINNWESRSKTWNIQKLKKIK